MDIESIDQIRVLVDAFYTKVRQDGLLGPVFAGVIHDEWQPHLNKMYDFWNAALFGVPGFRGNPFARHAPLPLQPQHFIRWLELFNSTVDQHFEGPIANEAKSRALLMATVFQSKLSRMKDSFKVIV